MQEESLTKAALRFLAGTVLCEIVILILVALVCFLLGWRSLPQYSTALFVAGVLILGFGTLGLSGLLSGTGDPIYQYGRTASPQTDYERAEEDIQDRMQSNRIHLVLLTAGIAAILISILIS